MWYRKTFSMVCLLAIAIMAVAQHPGVPPNIILIMADDLGFESVGCYGGTAFETPRLDGMAKEGMMFEQAFAYPLCTPTRVSLMTGKYNFRNWKAFGILDPEEKTFGHLMQDKGYKTCMVGKWQLQSYDPVHHPGSALTRGSGMKVDDTGFDEYCMWHTAHTEAKGSRYADPIIYENGRFLTNTNDKYGPDIFSDYLLDFVSRNKHKPFFAYYPMALPHSPFVPTPDSEEWSDKTKRHTTADTFYGDMVEYTDKVVGKVLDHLETEGIAENTLVLFYSDNGTHANLWIPYGNGKVQGGKSFPKDAGTRVPLMAYWKGRIADGRVSDEMISTPDFLPTLLEAIGGEVPSDFLTDGQSFFKELTGEEEKRKDWVYVDYDPFPGWAKDHLKPATFVRGERYKLYADGQFFDITEDQLEQEPITALDEIQSELKSRYQSIIDSLGRYPKFGYLESLDPELDKIVSPATKIEVITEGHTWSEGPVWIPSAQCLLYSDVPRNIAYKWTDMHGVEEFLEPSGGPEVGLGPGSNGMAIDQEGNLLICQTGNREVVKLLADYGTPVPVFQTLADNYNGKKFNAPNDLVADSQGNIYFTDPNFSLDMDEKELGFEGVYRIGEKGEVTLLSKNWPTPNGIGLSPDEQTLYFSNSNPARLIALDLKKGKVSNERVIMNLDELWEASVSKMRPDGMDVKSDGTIFLTGPDGILLISPKGKHLGTIHTDRMTSNCVFNEDESVLYATCDDLILRIKL